MKYMLVASVFACTALAAQPDWDATYIPAQGFYVDYEAHNLVVDRDGNSYVVGDTNYQQGVNLVKFGPDGHQRWVASLPESTFDYLWMTLSLDASQNPVVVASLTQGHDNGFCLAKFRKDDGVKLRVSYNWHSSSGDPVPPAPVAVMSDLVGNVYVAGTSRNDTTSTDIVICKFNETGDPKWTRYFDGQRHEGDRASGMAWAGDGTFYVGGFATDEARRVNAVVLKYDTAGSQRWVYTYMPNSSYKSKANCIGCGPDGSAYAAGSRAVVPGGQSEFLLVRLNSSGDTLWTRTDSGEAISLAVDSDSGVYLVGYNLRYARTWRYSPTGQLLWRDAYESDTLGKWWGFACLASDHCVYAVGGRYQTPSVPPDFRVLKYSPSGQALWEGIYDTTDSYRDELCAAMVGPDDAVYLAGTRTHEAGEYSHYLLMKYRSSGAVEEQPATPVEPERAIMASPSVVSSRCRFTVPAGERQSVLRIADITGRMVREIPVPAGRAGDRVSVTWDTRDEHGQLLPNGVYFVRVAQAQAQAQAVCKVIVQR